MKNLIVIIFCTVALISCKEKKDNGTFYVHGELKNIENQHIYLEQVFFNTKDPEVLDTAEIENGKFTVSSSATEEGLYRLRLEKQETGFIFINDKQEINFTADVKDITLQGPDFNTPANHSFKSFLINIDNRQKKLNSLSAEIDSLSKTKNNDSIIKLKIVDLNNNATGFKSFIVKSIDTLSDPVVAMFALGYTRGIEPAELKTVVPGLAKRFPAHQGIAGIITQYNEMMAKKTGPEQPPVTGNKSTVSAGMSGPEITMADTSGNQFSLSSLRGKYVLVDFWASWCAPCRGENPNIVANYNKYKNKNFTILGVSLDDDRAAWLKAIRKDKLAWKHVSDLKGWSSAAVSKYGFDAIPYNVLLDPQGKIIATELREGDLGLKLADVFK